MAWAQKFKINQGKEGRITFEVGPQLTETEIPKYIGEMDFSGKGMWNAYNQVAKVKKFQMKCIDGANTDIYAQWLSYTVTGLWMEDTAVLIHIFDKEPILRRDYGTAFTQRRTKGKYAPVQLLPAVQLQLQQFHIFISHKYPKRLIF